MSEVKVNKLSPRSGTTVTIGDSGDTITIPSGVTLSNSGTTTIAGKLSRRSGTRKLDGSYPTGTDNTALGDTALDSVEAGGTSNTVIGHNAGTAITTGDGNTAVGDLALDANTTSNDNVAIGRCALTTNITGANNEFYILQPII